MRFQFLDAPIDLVEDGESLSIEVHCCQSCGNVTQDDCDCYWVSYVEPIDMELT